ncbi:MAG TPA: DUF1802 family protein [Abditibacteriaceae bacterium]|nr:DUF1802 family protein [Abditibacteriaceae bacterium]
MDIPNCAVALKEWAITCQALRAGRQIVLLRKGGLHDAEGVFALEHNTFWLQPTYLHQSQAQVKPAHRDLFAMAEAQRVTGEGDKFIALRLLATVEKVFALTREGEDRLLAAPHIWSDMHVALRYDYQPEHPLLCVALRVYERPTPHQVAMRREFQGCRSWIELQEPLDCNKVLPALDDDAFARRMSELSAALV